MEDVILKLVPVVAVLFQCATVIVAIKGYLMVHKQLDTTRKIARSQLIVSLMERGWNFTELHDKIQNGEPFYDDPELVRDARDFLRFIETTMLLVMQKVVTPAEVFPAFGYRILTFMNNGYIMRRFLFSYEGDLLKTKKAVEIEARKAIDQYQPQNGEEPSARHYGAFALYEVLFCHMVDNFDDIKKTVLHYNIHHREDGYIYYDRSIFWRKSFKVGVRLFYHNGNCSLSAERMRKMNETEKRLKSALSRDSEK